MSGNTVYLKLKMPPSQGVSSGLQRRESRLVYVHMRKDKTYVPHNGSVPYENVLLVRASAAAVGGLRGDAFKVA